MRVALLRACKAERPPKRLSATDISLLLAKHTDPLLCGPKIPCVGKHCLHLEGMHGRRHAFPNTVERDLALPLLATATTQSKSNIWWELVASHLVLLELAQLPHIALQVDMQSVMRSTTLSPAAMYPASYQTKRSWTPPSPALTGITA